MLRRLCRIVFRLEFLLIASLAALILQLTWPAMVSWWNSPQPGRQTPSVFECSNPAGSLNRIGYWVSLPQDYANEDGKSWPLLLYLHGSGGRGDDLQLVKERGGLPTLIDAGLRLPMIVVSPQAPSGETWRVEPLLALVDHAMVAFRVDPDRVYVTGYSMGGFGAWSLAVAAPERFAAIVPVAGGGDGQRCGDLQNLPVWAFHGEKDNVVPLSAGQAMAEAARAAGANVKFTVFPDKAHGIRGDVYQDPKIFPWLLEQRLSDAERKYP